MEDGATSSREREARADGRAGFRVPRPSALRRLAWGGGDLGAALRDTLERELGERVGFHWLAVAFVAGAVIYFALPREPLLVALGPTTLLVGLVGFAGYRHGSPWRVAIVLAVCCAGTTAAKLRTISLAGPEIGFSRYAELTGRVAEAETRAERRPRIVLDRLSSPMIAPEAMPRRLRLSFSERYTLPPLGAEIAVKARVMPVSGPVVPGGYDPRRAAFFEGIGGSGFLLGKWTLVAPAPGGGTALAVTRVRAAIVARIEAALPGEAGALAAALLVGDRSDIPDDATESLRRSGLAHILAISGLHMMLVAGSAFFMMRAIFALSPRLALGRPILKWAALAALAVATIYLTLSGGGVATIRAYVMVVVMFVAVLADRPAISMRNLALAAFVVVALRPESVVEPGFQMSFAAVMALIAAWEAWRDRPALRLTDGRAAGGVGSLARSAWRAILATGLTTLVAGLATAPFAAYHFERVASYSLLANVLAAPLISLLVMPFGLLALVMMPFGLEALPLPVMGLGLDGVLAVARRVAALPGAELTPPPMTTTSLLVIVAGMLWLCLWRARWRLLGAPVIALGVGLAFVLVDRPDILVAPEGKVVAVRGADGRLRVSGGRAGSYTLDQLFDKENRPHPKGEALRKDVRCDSIACRIVGREGLSVAHIQDPAAFAEDCSRAQVVVTPLVAPADCAAPVVVDAARLRRFGPHALRVSPGPDGPRYDIATERGQFPRPWQAGGGSR